MNRYKYHLRIHLSTEWCNSRNSFLPHSAKIIKIDTKRGVAITHYDVFNVTKDDVYLLNDKPSDAFGFDISERRISRIISGLQRIFNMYPAQLAAFDVLKEHFESIISDEEFRIDRISLLTYSTMLGYKKLEEIKK